MGSQRSGGDVEAALVELRRRLDEARNLVEVLISQGVRPRSLAWALAELDQLQATMNEIAARRSRRWPHLKPIPKK